MFLNLLAQVTRAVSIDCPVLISFAKDLSMDTQQPAIWTALHADCCTANGVTCDGNSRVLSLHWNLKNLNGTISWSKLPPNIQTLRLMSNALSGPLPALFKSTLTWLNVGHNKITGTLPSSLPAGLLNLSIDDNFITGTYTGTWPSAIEDIWLSENLMSGDLRLNNLPTTVVELSIGWAMK